MPAKGEKHRAIRDLLLDSFTLLELEQFLKLNGYEEVAHAASPNVGPADFCFQVVEALDRMGRIDSEFFDRLSQARPAKGAQINSLGKLVLDTDGVPKSLHERLESDFLTSRPRPELLPVSDATPAVLGIAVGVSASMLTSIGPSIGEQRNRLQSVLESVKGGEDGKPSLGPSPGGNDVAGGLQGDNRELEHPNPSTGPTNLCGSIQEPLRNSARRIELTFDRKGRLINSRDKVCIEIEKFRLDQDEFGVPIEIRVILLARDAAQRELRALQEQSRCSLRDEKRMIKLRREIQRLGTLGVRLEAGCSLLLKSTLDIWSESRCTFENRLLTSGEIYCSFLVLHRLLNIVETELIGRYGSSIKVWSEKLKIKDYRHLNTINIYYYCTAVNLRWLPLLFIKRMEYMYDHLYGVRGLVPTLLFWKERKQRSRSLCAHLNPKLMIRSVIPSVICEIVATPKYTDALESGEEILNFSRWYFDLYG
jgi:hypothetical protein